VHHDTAVAFVGFGADKTGAPIGRAHRPFGQHTADDMRLLVPAALDRRPHLLLPRVIVADAERHQLIERYRALGIGVEQRCAGGGELEPLAYHRGGDTECSGDLLLALALCAQRLEGAELVERVQRLAVGVLGEAVLLGEAVGLDDAGNGRGLGQALLPDQQFQRPEAPSAGGDFEHGGLVAVPVQHGAHAQALQQGTPGDALGQRLDRDAGLHAADIGLAQDELVERDIPGRVQDDLLGRSHLVISATGRPGASLPAPSPVAKIPTALSLSAEPSLRCRGHPPLVLAD